MQKRSPRTPLQNLGVGLLKENFSQKIFPLIDNKVNYYFLRVQYIRHCIEGARLVLPKLWVKRQETTVLTAYYQYEFRVIARKP